MQVLYLFPNCCDTHAAADTQGGEAAFAVIALEHLVDEGDNDAGTGAADGVAEGQRAAVYVDLSKPSSRATAMDWAANASLASMRSMSDILRPAFSRAFLEAGTGPVPMIFGSTPP
jgi:hypothetical protein